MRSFTHVLSLFCAATAVFATYTDSTNSDVVSLTQETFYDFMEAHDLVLANFYAPWCRYSKALAPRFERAATLLKPDNIPLVKVDCSLEEELCSELDIGAYPTLKVFYGLEEPESYLGARDTEWIVSHMMKESAYIRGGLYLQSYD